MIAWGWGESKCSGGQLTINKTPLERGHRDGTPLKGDLEICGLKRQLATSCRMHLWRARQDTDWAGGMESSD